MIIGDVDKIIKSDSLITQIFDVIRIVDGNYNVYEYDNGKMNPIGEKCFAFWNRKEKCVNCVSMQAQKSGKLMVKIEVVKDKYYFILAKNIVVNGQYYIIEMLTEISQHLALAKEDKFADNQSFVKSMVAQLERISNKDAYLDLYNKNYIINKLEDELKQVKKDKRNLFMAFVFVEGAIQENCVQDMVIEKDDDLDFGDSAINNIAHSLVSRVEIKDGYVAKIAYDKFCILFNSSKEDECVSILHDIKIDINDIISTSLYPVSVKVGIEDVSKAENFMEAICQVENKMK